MDGFLNILKPPGMSSHDVVSSVRKILNIKKVGHAGTLDPAASGVILVAVGKATRFLEYVAATKKSYRAEILLGKATISGDLLGDVIEEKEITFPKDSIILDAISKFQGKIMQKPPAVSAIQIDGKRAYDLQRKGNDFDIPEREVEIFSIKLLKTYSERNTFLIDTTVSKGTYIRSLAVDIGNALKMPAVLKFLLRTSVGNINIENAITLEELSNFKTQAVLNIENCLTHIPRFDLDGRRKSAFLSGLSTRVKKTQPELLTVFSENVFLGVASYKNGEVIPVKVYRNEDL